MLDPAERTRRLSNEKRAWDLSRRNQGRLQECGGAEARPQEHKRIAEK